MRDVKLEYYDLAIKIKTLEDYIQLSRPDCQYKLILEEQLNAMYLYSNSLRKRIEFIENL